MRTAARDDDGALRLLLPRGADRQSARRDAPTNQGAEQ